MISSRTLLDGLVYPELRADGPLNLSGQPPERITYSFHDEGTEALADHRPDVTGWAAWTETERDVVRAALAELERHVNLTFVERNTNRSADIPLGLATGYALSDRGGQTYYGFTYQNGVLKEVTASVSVLLGADSSTYYHEIGHALGLKHSFEGPVALPEAFDNTNLTVMSYDEGGGRLVFDPSPGTGDWRHFDIAALRSVWGAAEIDEIVLGDFGADAGGWTGQDRFPRLVGDVNGDGRADIVGFGAKRGFTALADGDGGFDAPGNGIANFAAAQGWTSSDAFTRLLGDVNGDGQDDIIGFGARATFTALSDGSGGFGDFRTAIGNFAADQGWISDDRYPRVAADVNGDGIDDIIGFGNAATYTALGRGDGSFGAFRLAIDDFARAQGWSDNSTYLRVAGDVNGDGQDDIIGFGNAAVYTAISRGDGTFHRFRAATDEFSRAEGWGNAERTPRLVGDLNGDGVADLVGLGPDIAWAAIGTGSGRFRDASVLTADFTEAAGWDGFDRMPRQLADIDGDGRDDLIGFSESGVVVLATALSGDLESTDRSMAADWFDFG